MSIASGSSATEKTLAVLSVGFCIFFIHQGLVSAHWSYLLTAAAWAMFAVSWLLPRTSQQPNDDPSLPEQQVAAVQNRHRLRTGAVAAAIIFLIAGTAVRWLAGA